MMSVAVPSASQRADVKLLFVISAIQPGMFFMLFDLI